MYTVKDIEKMLATPLPEAAYQAKQKRLYSVTDIENMLAKSPMERKVPGIAPLPSGVARPDKTDGLGYLASKAVTGLATGLEGAWNYFNRISEDPDMEQRTIKQEEAALAGKFPSWSLRSRETREKDLEKLKEKAAKGYQPSLAAMEEAAIVDDRYNNPTGALKVAGDVASAAGGMTPAMAANVILPGSGYAIMFAGAAGNATEEAILSGASKDKALLAGTLSGGVEVATEALFGGIPGFGAGLLSKGLTGAAEGMLKGLSKSVAGKYLLGKAVDILGEGAEELLSEYAAPFIKKIYNGDQRGIGQTLAETTPDALYSMLIGSLTSGVLNGVSTGADVKTKTSQGKALQSQAQLIVSEGLAAPKDSAAFKTATSLQAKVASGKAITDFELGMLNAENVAALKEPYARKITESLVQEAVTQGKAVATPQDTTITKQSNVVDEAKYIKDQTVDRATQAGVEPYRAEQIAGIASRLGIEVEFDSALPQQGLYRDGKITLNPTADPFSIFKHELTHHLEGSGLAYDDLMNTLLDDGDNNSILQTFLSKEAAKAGRDSLSFQEYKDYLKQTYQNEYTKRGETFDESMLYSEIVANIVGEELFSNEKSIQRLMQTDRNLFDKIYQWIKDTLAKLRGTPQEKALLRAELLYRKAASQVQPTQNAAAKYQFLGIQNGIETYETSDEIKNLPLDQKRRAFLDLIKGQYQGRTARFVKNGKKYYAYLFGEGNRKIAYGDRRSTNAGFEAKINTLADGGFFDLIENARYQASATPAGSKPSSSFIHKVTQLWDYYVKTVQIDTRLYDVIINVGDAGNNQYVYDVSLTENKKKNAPITGQSQIKAGGHSSSNINVAQAPSNVNTQYMPPPKKNTPGGKPALLNPIQTAMLTEKDVTIPTLTPTESENGSKTRRSFENFTNKQQAFGDEFKAEFLANEDGRYREVTNDEAMAKAFSALQKDPVTSNEIFLTKDPKAADYTDVATGLILMKWYQDSGDHASMVRVAQKLAQIGTEAGRNVQMFALLSRMTPEGMVYYAQDSLGKALERLKVGKTKEWIDSHKDQFTLNEEDIEFITRRVLQAQKAETTRARDVMLGEIAARIQSKVPPEKGSGIRALQRISLLLNPRTLGRNVIGNALMVLPHTMSDVVATGADKLTSQFTGLRTTAAGTTGMIAGAKQGARNTWDDYRRGIDTKGFTGRYEDVGGLELTRPNRSFNKSNVLNRADQFLSMSLEMGDRPFYDSYYNKALNGMMQANQVTKATQEMRDLAAAEALQRTWQDTNSTTKLLTTIQNGLNKVIPLSKGGRFGLGNIVIPFVKTPANLTRAVVEFSPVGLVKALTVDMQTMMRAKENGTLTMKMQRDFVRNFSNGVVGTLGMMLSYIAASAGMITGGNDDDKDVAAFERNVLGINPYSVKIGNKTFTYDWAQPLATSMAMMADAQKAISTEDGDWGDGLYKGLTSGFETLFEQSVFKSLLSLMRQDGIVKGFENAIQGAPAMFVPTLLSQIGQLFDDTARTTYEYGDGFAQARNRVLARIPGARENLQPVVDVLGREVKSNTEPVNVFLNPANFSTANPTKASEEMLRLYKQTGDKAVIPKVAPYYFNWQGEKIILTPQQKTQYQKIMGSIASDEVENLLTDSDYKSLSDEGKATVIKKVYEYAEAYAKQSTTKYRMDTSKQKVAEAAARGVSPSAYYSMRNAVDSDGNGSVSAEEAKRAISSAPPEKAATLKNELVYSHSVSELSDKQQENFKSNYSVRGLTEEQYLDICNQLKEVEGQKDKNGETISGSLKSNRYKKLIQMGYAEKWVIWILNHDYGYKPPFK